MRKFLPKAAQGADYPITPALPASFTNDEPTLLEKIGVNIDVLKAQTEGRIPSPVSRAYMFYVNLFSGALEVDGDGLEDNEVETRRRLERPGRRQLLEEARRTLRGMCAAFALRGVLGIKIELHTVDLDPLTDELSAVLVPMLRSAPGNNGFWHSIRFYTVQVEGGEPEVLAGLSPLTAFFPAANPPKALTGLYWYDAARGRWYDPTSDYLDADDQLRVSFATKQKVSQAIRSWLQRVVREMTPGCLAELGLSRRDEALVKNEFTRWLSELDNVGATTVAVEKSALSAPGRIAVPFLEWACQGDPSHVLTDLPLHRGQLVVTADQLMRRQTRIYGRTYGERRLEQQVRELPIKGDNLGLALGMGPNAIPEPYVVVDRLFTTNLTVLTSKPFSAEWSGLEVVNGAQREYCLLPFRPEILEILEPVELLGSVSGELSQDTLNYIVRLRFGDETIEQLYATSGKGRMVVDSKIDLNSFDIRFFPNFDLDATRHLLRRNLDERVADEDYHARVRLSPYWDFRIWAFRLDNGSVRETGLTAIRGTTNDCGPEELSPGVAQFFTLPEKPTGFCVEDRGFCLINLPNPIARGANPADWEIGVDFGTSNTCVAYRPAASDRLARPLDLPVLTTTLFKDPQYNLSFGHVNEGNSAVYDFFYKFEQRDQLLNEQEYFPTQVLTQQEQLGPGDEFELANGLIYFKNVTLTGVSILELTKGFSSPEKQGRRLQKRFSLKQNIKWRETEWLRAFMHHLRKQIVLTAAYNNARVTQAKFSYPKAFSLLELTNFKATLRRVWQPSTSEEMKTVSESEAVRNYLVVNANQHIVFDVGGGTTDIIGFNANQPVFQTSFKLAAGQINDYVTSSPAFCLAFAGAINEELGGRLKANMDVFRQAIEEGNREQVANAWVGLLQSVESMDGSGERMMEIMNRLRSKAYEEGAVADAVRGFFLSVTLLYGSLAYFAGRLLRASAEGRFERGQAFPLTGVTLALTGNGSKLYSVLTMEEASFARVFQDLFEFGLGRPESVQGRIKFNGIHHYENKPAPKVTVALGLLTGSTGDDVSDIPVANIAGEEDYVSENGKTTTFESSLVQIYRHIRQNESRFVPPSAAPPNLVSFLDQLAELLPSGRNGQFEVIPKVGKHWHVQLKGDFYKGSLEVIRDRLIQNARAIDADMAEHQEEYLPALEPLFIAEIIGLLDQIRERYSG
jgi:hypothetical protein